MSSIRAEKECERWCAKRTKNGTPRRIGGDVERKRKNRDCYPDGAALGVHGGQE
jgi:hypothetical protein